MDKKIKIGVVGMGRIGKLHTENIIRNFKNVEVKAVSDVCIENAKEWANNLGINNVYEDYQKILNDKEIDSVLICSSTNTHTQLIIESARAKKNIFCEKPIGYDIEEITKALKVVKETGVKLQIGFNRRFDHNFSKVRNIIEEGAVGQPHIIKVTSRDPEEPPIEYIKVSGGMLFDMTIHDFDMVRYLSGSDVEEVYTTGAVLVNEDIGKVGDIDTAIVTLKLKDGSIAVIDNSRKAVYGYDQRVEVFGSEGSVQVSNDTDSSAIISNKNGVISEKPKFFFLERYKDSFIKELEDFFNAVSNDGKVPVDGLDGLQSVLIAKAATKSLKEGKPIKIL
ncbi:inositol 2-dehydrogenase [Clostridium rectalis]|uniref:inositol 2-dehydrogenase n=1 Tax=Clostridium rectalis TaxID=2040295 RepID=UPI000F634741